jgi:hypothetical protein
MLGVFEIRKYSSIRAKAGCARNVWESEIPEFPGLCVIHFGAGDREDRLRVMMSSGAHPLRAV